VLDVDFDLNLNLIGACLAAALEPPGAGARGAGSSAADRSLATSAFSMGAT